MRFTLIRQKSGTPLVDEGVDRSPLNIGQVLHTLGLCSKVLPLRSGSIDTETFRLAYETNGQRLPQDDAESLGDLLQKQRWTGAPTLVWS